MDKEQKEPSVKKNAVSRLDKFASIILLLGIFLTPILYLPWLNFSPEVPKKFFLIGTVVIALLLWFLARLKAKKLLLVKSSALATGGVFLLLALVSSLLSSSPSTSLVGLGFESGTWLSLAVLFGLMFLVSEYTRSKQKFLNVYLGLFIVFSLAFLFQAARLIFGDWLPWPIFDNAAINLIGKWNDLGVLAGLMAISSVVILELFPLQEARVMKNFIWGVLGAALLTMILVNFSLIWIVTAVVLVFVYAYNISFLARQAGGGGKKIMKISLVVFLISLAFIIFGQPISYDAQGAPHEGYLATQTRKLAEKANVAYLEVRPSLAGTYSLTENSLKLSPVFGTGPNTFSSVWLKNKPAGVNESQFWNIEPAFGVGFVPSFFVTTGLMGGLALILFILLLVYLGVKALINSQTDSLEKSFLILSFAGLIYVWALLIFYVSETSVLAITFVITGLFIARLVDLGEIKTKEIVLTANPKTKFVSSLSGAVIGIVLVVLIGAWLTTAGSLLAFQRASNALQVTGNADQAEKYVNIAIRLNPQDIYYRLAAQVNVAQMNILLNKKITQTELMAAYAKIFAKAKGNVDAAVVANNQNYLNYVTRGSLYENIMSLGVSGAYELAKENYTKSLTYNPHGPDMYLNLARLEIANKDFTAAEKYLDQSLAEKKNYIDAIFLQSQLYAQRGFLDSAIKRAEYASQLAPADTSILFQLGYLQYRNADYREAVTTFKSALALVPGFANAKYFLGLSYDKLGLTDSAIKEFVEIQKNNPDNAELKQVLSNLRAGKDALAGAEPVEKKVAPPVKQN